MSEGLDQVQSRRLFERPELFQQADRLRGETEFLRAAGGSRIRLGCRARNRATSLGEDLLAGPVVLLVVRGAWKGRGTGDGVPRSTRLATMGVVVGARRSCSCRNFNSA